MKRHAAVKTLETCIRKNRVTNIGEEWQLEAISKSLCNAFDVLGLPIPEIFPQHPK
ncbi:MAG: hypothetical protein ACI4QT_02665 [Kiritimatiellia bacterium]